MWQRETDCQECLDDAADLREELVRTVRDFGPSAPLLMSGGVHSATLLAAMLAAGGQPTLYTFTWEGWEATDIVRQMAWEHNSLEVVPVPFPWYVAGRMIADGYMLGNALLQLKDHLTAPAPTAARHLHMLFYMVGALLNDSYSVAVCGGRCWYPGTAEAEFAQRLGVTLYTPVAHAHPHIMRNAFPEFWEGRDWHEASDAVWPHLRDVHRGLLQGPLNPYKLDSLGAFWAWMVMSIAQAVDGTPPLPDPPTPPSPAQREMVETKDGGCCDE